MQKLELKRTSASLLTCVILAAGGMAFTGPALAASTGGAQAGVQTMGVTGGAAQDRGSKHADRRGGHRRGMHRQMIDAAMMLPGYGPIPQEVVESLSLDSRQAELLKDAKAFMDQSHSAKRERYGKSGISPRSMKLTEPVDPHAAVKAQEERFAAMQQTRAQSTQKWLAVWDSLESGQQQTLSEYVVKQANERAEYRAKRKSEHQKRRADQRSKQG